MGQKSQVTVELVGGLGNQLFCLSAGFYVARLHSADLKMKYESKLNSTTRNSAFSNGFAMSGGDGVELVSVVNRKNNSFVNSLVTKVVGLLKVANPWQESMYKSKVVGFDPKLDSIMPPVYLKGYFQSWKYALNSKSFIRRALFSQANLSDYATSLIQELNAEKTLVVHIRLGDYLLGENSYFGVLDAEYYKNALLNHDLLKYQVFVFSDDINHAESNYSHVFPENTIWVDPMRKLNDLESLIVMLHGKSYVIANSTFSWWAAFLSDSKTKVVAPAKWFRFREDPDCLFPLEWERECSIWTN
jgi:hypothetical protein